MANPFKPDDRVQTKVKGTIVDAVVRLIWNDEVQVRIPDKTLLWRSVKTVWVPGTIPLEPREPATGENTAPGSILASTPGEVPAPSESANPTQDAAPSAETSPSPNEDASAATDNSSSIETPAAEPKVELEAAAPNVENPASELNPINVTACSGGEPPLVKRKKGRRKK